MKLSEFDLEVMQLLWDQGDNTAPELHRHIVINKDVTYSTVKTIIDRLEDKKAIHRVKTLGRTIIYAPLISREEVRKPMLANFITKVFSGNPKSLINHVIEDTELSDRDIEYLESLLRDKKQNND